MSGHDTHDYGSDIYTEAEGSDDTLANLGPLRALAGVWTSADGADAHPVGPGSDITGPVIDGQEHNTYVERYELQPIDPQTSGPQLFYGLRYHTHIVKPGEVETFHDQVGYWLWEPAANTVIMTLGIPRGQVLLAAGHAALDARDFELVAERGSEVFGICSNPFLDASFRTMRYRIDVTVNADGTSGTADDTRPTTPVVMSNVGLVNASDPTNPGVDRQNAVLRLTAVGAVGSTTTITVRATNAATNETFDQTFTVNVVADTDTGQANGTAIDDRAFLTVPPSPFPNLISNVTTNEDIVVTVPATDLETGGTLTVHVRTGTASEIRPRKP